MFLYLIVILSVDEYIPLYEDHESHSGCCYSRMHWGPGSSVDDYKEDQSFCNEPDLKDVQQQRFYEQAGTKTNPISTYPNTPQTSTMGWTHQSTSIVQGWRASPSSSSNLFTYNSSKNNLSKPSSSSNHISLSKASTNSSRYNTQSEALPIKEHGPETPSLLSSTIDSVMHSSSSYQPGWTARQTSYDNEGIAIL